MIDNSSITGSVYIADATYGEFPEVQVRALGPYGTLSTKTDKNGVFWFRNVGNGTYDLECSLPGYGSIRTYGIQVFGNDTAYANFAQMNPLPDNNLSLPELITAHFEENILHISTNGTDCGNGYRAVRFFFGTDNQVSDEEFRFTTISSLLSSCQFQLPLYITDIFESGEIVYVVGYRCTFEDMGYVNLHTGIQVFPTVNEKSRSNVISFMMP